MPTPGMDRFAREDLSIVTYNVHGLNVHEKHSRLLRDLKHYKTSIAFLQETHFQEGRAPALKDRYFRQGYFSNNPDRLTLGVGILFSSRIPYVEQATLRCKQGRYIFTKGTILDQTYTFANLYSPNTKQHLFLRTALNTLMKFTEGTLIVGGDLNLTLHAEQDSTAKHRPTPDNRNARTLRTIHYHQLADYWRALHPLTRDYTFYSITHSTYSRLDYFLMPHRDLVLLNRAEILPMTWSDQCPVRITVKSPLYRPRQTSWRLNESILSDVLVVEKTRQSIQDYFTDNKQGDTTPLTCWEAHKVVIRGQIITTCATRKREATQATVALSKEIAALEAKHKRTLDAETYRDLTVKREQLSTLLNCSIQRSYQHFKHIIHEHGNKCGRLLANLLKQRKSLLYIPKIKGPRQQHLHLPDQIASAFLTYYQGLYHLRQDTPEGPHRHKLEEIQRYLDTARGTRLENADRENLETPISTEELALTIKKAKTGKAPGPYGFPLSYYKTFTTDLLPKLQTALNSILEGATPTAQFTTQGPGHHIRKRGADTTHRSMPNESPTHRDHKPLTPTLLNKYHQQHTHKNTPPTPTTTQRHTDSLTDPNPVTASNRDK
ncbi:Hypothetical predicted protein [Pelobates cultripes]|uniref:Endonuclease/exonuclease/phosphatase domain-containing protein n=1 Tax=Pelobates cultripes TaxID=61616 RepID=A0AAD1VNE6_PELCU|nr:Hypothetical predicted protein [Pelobates cultripes]